MNEYENRFYDVMACPVCGWAIEEIVFELIIPDPECYRCGATHYSEFEPQRLGKVE